MLRNLNWIAVEAFKIENNNINRRANYCSLFLRYVLYLKEKGMKYLAHNFR